MRDGQAAELPSPSSVDLLYQIRVLLEHRPHPRLSLPPSSSLSKGGVFVVRSVVGERTSVFHLREDGGDGGLELLFLLGGRLLTRYGVGRRDGWEGR